MASENVKIKIKEVDKTSPAGNGIDSTDIAFIPGFSVLAEAPKNIPTLCTTVREFETLFGKKPRRLTLRDVANYTNYGFISGDYDRSYVYAKELLYQGMPVVYSNVVSDTIEDDSISVNLASVKFGTENTDITSNLKATLSGDHNTILVSVAPNTNKIIEGSADIIFNVEAIAEAATDNIPQKTSFEYALSNADIIDTDIEEDDVTFTDPNPCCVVEKLSNTQIEITNRSSADKTLQIPVKVTLNVSLNPDEQIELVVREVQTSCLDVFYAADKDGDYLINKQWEINPENEKSIADKSVYSVKYITSGGYPSVIHEDKKGKSVFADKMLACAAHRGDAVALIDYQMSKDINPFSTDPESESFYSCMHSVCSAPGISGYGEYGTAMYPWSTYTCTSLSFADSSIISMPASFAYLSCLARTIKTSPNWLAMAGVTRGVVPGIHKLLTPSNALSNTVAEEMQPKFGVENHNISVNCITNVRPYGLTLWGNRTLKPVSNEGTVALNFLNTRNMLSDIKKLLYTTAKSCMFEQNSDDLWLKFKDGIRPLLDRLKAGNGISEYKIVRGTTKYNGDPLTKGEIAAVIKIYPMYAVEYFELTVEINDEEVTVD